MNKPEFDAFQKNFFEEIANLTNTKGEEYKTNADQLSNFKTAAAQIGIDPITVLFLYMNKHYNSIVTYVKDRQNGVNRVLSEPIKGRLQDLALYSILMAALIEDLEIKVARDYNPT